MNKEYTVFLRVAISPNGNILNQEADVVPIKVKAKSHKEAKTIVTQRLQNLIGDGRND